METPQNIRSSENCYLQTYLNRRVMKNNLPSMVSFILHTLFALLSIIFLPIENSYLLLRKPISAK